MNIFNFFKRKPESTTSHQQMTMDLNSIFFHEDDFCQIEIIPNDIDNLTAEIEKIKEFSDKHSDGIGYTNMYIRNENSKLLSDRKIETDELIKFLDKLNVKKFITVYTGYGSSYRLISENTIGYGAGYSAIYFDFKDDIVQNIWITNPSIIDKANFAAVLNSIGLKWNLVLADWSSDTIVNLTDVKAIKAYFKIEEEK